MKNEEDNKPDKYAPRISFEEWQRQRGKGQRLPLEVRMKNSRYGLIRVFYTIGKSVITIFIAIGGFLAWLISFFLL